MAKPVQQQQHQRFEDNGDSDSLTAQVAEDVLENLNSSAATGSGSKKGSYDSTSSSSDDSDDDDDAPEAVQVSSARSKERERLAKLQSMQTASKQAKRKRDATLKLQKEQSKSDRKGKGRADREDLQVDEDFEQGDTQLAAVVAVGEGTRRRNKHHQVFDNDDQPEPSTSSAPRLDPALFQQAELALQQAKERALQEEREKREEEARVAEAALERQSSSRKRGSKRSRADGTATRIIGDTVIQQVPPEGRAGQANIDPSTSLTPKHNEKFLNDRLFKRKTARVSKNKGDKGKGKEEEKPFLLFDPLLDKPKKTKAAKPLTRSEMEERMRFRKSAQTTFLKSQKRSMGPSIAFGASSAAKSGRAFQKGSAI